MFQHGGKSDAQKANTFKGNQHTRDPNEKVSKLQVQKRMSAKLQKALVRAPREAKDKWHAICALKGQRNASIFFHKKEFMMQWVSDPEWDNLAELFFTFACAKALLSYAMCIRHHIG